MKSQRSLDFLGNKERERSERAISLFYFSKNYLCDFGFTFMSGKGSLFAGEEKQRENYGQPTFF